MATKQSTKPGKVTAAVALSAPLELIAHQIAGALQETASLSETLGNLTRDAGKLIVKAPDQLEPFVDACRQMCDAVGLTEGSVKVYLSNIRGVLRAMVGGFKPKGDQTLRSMYESAPKGTGRQKATGARHATDKPASGITVEELDVEHVEAKPVSKEDARRAAIVALFGHCDDELIAAVTWAASHEASFVNYVKANVAAASKPELKRAA